MKRVLRGLAVGVLFIGFLIFILEPIQSPPKPLCSWLNHSQPIVLAHRGSRFLIPENSLLGFKVAESFGVDVLETDVRLTRDNHLVIFHDETVDRTTNGKGRFLFKSNFLLLR